MNTIRFFANKNDSGVVDPLDIGHRPLGTDLFELQVGLIEIGNGQAVWGGSLQNVNNGEKRYFKSWSSLDMNLRKILTPSVQLEVLKALMQTKEVVY